MCRRFGTDPSRTGGNASGWCGARGRGKRIPRTRAASGLRPGSLWTPARSWLTAVGSAGRVGGKRDKPLRRTGADHRKARQELEPKARPGAAVRTPRWSAERRPHIDEMCGKTEDWCVAWRSIPSLLRGTKGKDGDPGAANNTGDDARLPVIPGPALERRPGMTRLSCLTTASGTAQARDRRAPRAFHVRCVISPRPCAAPR